MPTTDKKTNNKLITPVFRGSYCNLVTPKRPSPDADPRYSIMIVLPKDDAETKKFIKRLEKQFQKAGLEKHGKQIPFSKMKHFPIKDGDEEDEDGNTNPEHEGCWCINAASKFRPGAIDKAGNPLIDEEDLYSGAWYRASVSAWAWAHNVGGKGVSVNLHNVQKVKDDEKFGGGAPPEDDFADYIGDEDEDGDDEDDLDNL